MERARKKESKKESEQESKKGRVQENKLKIDQDHE